MEDYENAYPQRPFLVQNIMKEGSFTLIGGSSAAGKSTLVYQEVWSWISYQTFLGFPCTRIPRFWYIAFDRLLPTIHDQLSSMGIFYDDWVSVQSMAMVNFNKKGITLPAGMAPGDVLILDGLDFLVKGGQIKEFAPVSDLCQQCAQIIASHQVSFIGVIGANKPRSGGKNDDGGSPFDRLSGSGVWQRISETNMVIEVMDPRNTECNKRILHVRPRLAAPFQRFYQFKDNGWMVEVTDPATLKTPLGFLSMLPDFRHFKLQEAVKIGKDNQLSERTVFRLIDFLVDEKKALEKISHGTYRKKNTTH